jgi:Lrp/AsnC family transcriptional regulator, leucine-responsive regulatory protein
MDAIDKSILNLMQHNGRISNAEIARTVNLAPSAVLERVRKLEREQVIEGYQCKVNNDSVDCGLTAFIYIDTDDRAGDVTTAEQLAKLSFIQEVHHIAGEDCYLVKMKARDTKHLAKLMRDHLSPIQTIRSTKTTIVLETLKEECVLPIPTDAQTEVGQN